MERSGIWDIHYRQEEGIAYSPHDGNRPDLETTAIVIPANAGIHSMGLGWVMDADFRRHDGNYYDLMPIIQTMGDGWSRIPLRYLRSTCCILDELDKCNNVGYIYNCDYHVS